MELGSSIVGWRKQLYIMLSRQRSGSTLLRSYINSHPDMIAFGELFYPDASPEFMAGYYHYWLQRIASDRSSIILEREPLALLETYLESLSGVVEFKRAIVIDVKYSQADSVPNLFRFIQEQCCPVIHLVRDNVLATYISDLVGNARLAAGHGLHGIEKLPSTPVTIETAGLVKELDQRCFEHLYYSQKIGLSGVLELKYEECVLTVGNQTTLPEKPARRLCEFTSCKYADMTSDLRKQGSASLQDMVANWCEVRAILRGTKYSYLCGVDFEEPSMGDRGEVGNRGDSVVDGPMEPHREGSNVDNRTSKSNAVPDNTEHRRRTAK